MTRIHIVKAIAFAVMCFYLIEEAKTASNGVIGICDATFTKFGCIPSDWPVVDGVVQRKKCTDTSAVMAWASRTIRTDDIITFAGEELNPMTSYQPGKILDFTVKVIDYKLKYRGLLLYAVDESNTRVGRFVVLPESPQLFHAPFGFDPSEHACGNVITHSSADFKPLEYTFKYVPPKEGTGKITFRILIKEGDANVGAFFWPNLAGDIELTESTEELPKKTWLESEPGQSCNVACAAIRQGCDETALTSVNDADSLGAGVSDNNLLCNSPFIADCTQLGIFKKGSHCFYQDDTCNTPATCSQTDNDITRFCPCSSGVPVNTQETPAPSSTTNDTPGSTNTSPAMKKTGSVNIIASLLSLALLLSFGGKSKSQHIVFLVGILCLSSFFTGAMGHNWVNSLARATNEGSQVAYCPPKTEDVAHVQVGIGQSFEIEWTQGHPGNKWSDARGETPYAYFTIVKAADESKLGELSADILDKYLENGPASAAITGVKQYHRQINGGEQINVQNDDHPDLVYKREIMPTDPDWIERPGEPFYGTKRYTKHFKNNRLFEYNDTKIAGAIHMAYTDTERPWILGVYRFKLALGLDRAQDIDFANFKIPEGAATGSYVVQYFWKGYFDCIDVLLVQDFVPSPYGSVPLPGDPVPEPAFKRVDHCFAPDYQKVHGECKLITANDPTPCLDDCNNAPDGTCDGIVIVPTKLESIYTIDGYYPSECSALKTQHTDDDQGLLCYAVQAREPTTTLSKIVTSKDPRDPVFLSTCLIKKSTRTTGQQPTATQVTIPSIYRDKCISCSDALAFADQSKVFAWNFVEKCKECGVSVFTGGEQPEVPDNTPIPPPTTFAPFVTQAPTTVIPTAVVPTAPPPVTSAPGVNCPPAVFDTARYSNNPNNVVTHFMATFPVSDKIEYTATITTSNGGTPNNCFTNGDLTPMNDNKLTYSGRVFPGGASTVDVVICHWPDVYDDITVTLTNCRYLSF